MESRIRGITYRKHFYMSYQERHFYGYDDKNNIIMTNDSFEEMILFDLIEKEHKDNQKEYLDSNSFELFITFLVDELKILNWKELYRNDMVDDGQEWEVILHYDSGLSRSFGGVNAFPKNFSKFKKKCKLYKFGI